jgi:transglutaminase-like putative cysteine protease
MTNAAPQAGDAENPDAYLAPTFFLDSDHPLVRALADEVAGVADPRERAVRLYYAVRDRVVYDPYSMAMVPDTFRASRVLEAGRGYCVAKAALLAAVARAAGIPARLGFADVRNHLATERLLRLIGTDVFYWHGYTDFYLEGRWVKATPAFNIELCRRFRVLPLEFDGRADSIFHPFDADNRRHMEYLNDRGSWSDVPFEIIRAEMLRHYPRMFAGGGAVGGDFAAEAAAENRIGAPRPEGA